MTEDGGGLALLAELERAGAITKTSLTLPESITYEQYEALFGMFGDVKDSMCWLIGDLINHGEKVYGHTYAQAVHATGLNEGTLSNYASVCARIPRSRRRPPERLKFSVHAEVAYMSPKEQEHWLKAAELNGWKRQQLREALAPVRSQRGTSRSIITPGGVEVIDDEQDELPAGEGETVSRALAKLPPAGESDHICQCPACGRYHRMDVDVRD